MTTSKTTRLGQTGHSLIDAELYYGPDRRGHKDHNLEECVKRFFEILDVKEISNNDVEFSPVYISSVRLWANAELYYLFERMQELVK